VSTITPKRKKIELQEARINDTGAKVPVSENTIQRKVQSAKVKG